MYSSTIHQTKRSRGKRGGRKVKLRKAKALLDRIDLHDLRDLRSRRGEYILDQLKLVYDKPCGYDGYLSFEFVMFVTFKDNTEKVRDTKGVLDHLIYKYEELRGQLYNLARLPMHHIDDEDLHKFSNLLQQEYTSFLDDQRLDMEVDEILRILSM